MNIKTFASRMNIDYDALMEDFCGDAASLKDRIQTFSPLPLFENLKKAISDNDSEAVHSQAHKIRKGAQSLHLETMAKAARRIEDGIDADADEAISILEKEISLFAEAVKG